MALRLIATAAFGLESVVEREIAMLGYEDRMVESGRVLFTGDNSAVCRSNLWLRSADRLLVQIGVFSARNFNELFEGTKALPWEQFIPKDGNFPVKGRSVKSQLRSVPDCQAIVKKAIVERLKKAHRAVTLPETGSLYPVTVSLLEDSATLTLDTSGAGLHKRGYRKVVGTAPLKETLAAGLLSLARWHSVRPLLDPFCGSGTIPVEAALMGCNIAPGLGRKFVSEEWPAIPSGAWQTAREEAQDTARPDQELLITGSDIDTAAITLAREHAALAGVGKKVRFAVLPVRSIRASGAYGCVVTNPPYGERLMERKQLKQAYSDLAQALGSFDSWSVFVLTAYPQFERVFGRQADKRRRLYNGPIECTYYQYLGPLPPRKRA